MANLSLKLGSYTFPPTFYAEQIPTLRSIPNEKLPRADGGRQITGYLESKTFRVKGALVSGHEAIPTGTQQTLRAQLDALKAACNAGQVSFQTHDDRYWRNCQVSGFQEQYDPTGPARYVDIAFDVMTGDPFAYGLTTQTDGRTITATAQTKSLSVGGNAYTLPTISLTIGTGTSADIVLTNTTTGEVATLNGSVSPGDVYVIDSLGETVTRSGLDKISLFDGLFLRLTPGTNVLKVEYSGATVTALSVTWNERYF